MTFTQLPGVGAFAWRQEEPRWYEHVAECYGEMRIGAMQLVLCIQVRWDHTAFIHAVMRVNNVKVWESAPCLAWPKLVADRKRLIDELRAQGLDIPPRTTVPPIYSPT